MKRSFLINAFLTTFLLIFAASQVAAQEIALASNDVSVHSMDFQGPRQPQELQALLDSFFVEQLREMHIPGAVFILVRNGKVFFQKGYGFADFENHVPVVPEKTEFRVASISKLVTATAVMQLCDRGLIDLDDDINGYLKAFKLDYTFDKPITFRHLLTHTSGLDRQPVGMYTHDKDTPVPLGQCLASHIPAQIAAPGERLNYSNYGMALAGYLVQEISGTPFAQYVEQNIFHPLGMQNSSFEPRPELNPNTAVSYDYKDGKLTRASLDHLNLLPAGGLISTACDMARFLTAHLQNGRYENARILQEATARKMHQQQFTFHASLPGWDCGFYEASYNHHRVLMHSGNGRGCSSLLLLVPDQNLGFFVAYNRWVPEVHEKLIKTFFDHYYPVFGNGALPKMSDHSNGDLKRFCGTYRYLDYPQKSVFKATLLTGKSEEYRITANEDGTLNAFSARWHEVEPLLFQKVDSEEYFAFRPDQDGQVTHIFMLKDMPYVFEKLGPLETKSMQDALVEIFKLIFASGVLFLPIVFLIGRLQGVTEPAESNNVPARKSYMPFLTAGLIFIVCIFNLFFLMEMNIFFDKNIFIYGIPDRTVAALGIPLLTAALAVILAAFSFRVWKRHYWSLFSRIHYTLVTLTSLTFILFLNYWNLLGFRF